MRGRSLLAIPLTISSRPLVPDSRRDKSYRHALVISAVGSAAAATGVYADVGIQDGRDDS